MASMQDLPQLLSLPAIHAHWTATLSLPPTAQLSTLRRLVRAVTKDHHPALRPLSLVALCPLYLDLALAYAFLGEYYLASKVFREAVDNDATSAVGWFGLGLAQAELGEWKNARRSWKECLQCFESVSGQEEVIPYVCFQAHGETAQMLAAGLDSGVWKLERTRVEFNFQLALLEKGSKKLGVKPILAGQERPAPNGLPAGLRFGPGWDANLQSLVSPLLAQHSASHTKELGDGAGSTGNPQTAVQTPPSSSTSRPRATLPPRISSRKPLPRPPPTPVPSLADAGSFNDHKPSLDKDPFTSSPEENLVDPFSTSSHTLTTRPCDGCRERFSRQSTLCTAEDQYFYDGSDEDNEEDHDPFSDIDDTIANWSGLGPTQEDQTEEDHTQVEIDGANETYEAALQDRPDLDGEILQPRVFQGFGSPSKQM